MMRKFIFAIILGVTGFLGVYIGSGQFTQLCRYAIPFVAKFPVYTILTFGVMTGAIIAGSKKIEAFRPEVNSVESYRKQVESSGIELSPLDLTKIFKASDLINRNVESDDQTTEYESFENIVKRYTQVYNTLPRQIQNSSWIQKNNLNFQEPTSFRIAKIHNTGYAIYFIDHVPPCVGIKVENFQSLPTIQELSSFAGKQFPPTMITRVVNEFQQLLTKPESVLTDGGYGQAGFTNPTETPWSYGFLPIDITKFDYRHFVADALQLNGFIRK